MSGNSYPLHNAVITRNLAEIEKLTAPSSGVDINDRDAAGIPPLHYAIHLGYIDIMKYLISKGADTSRKSAAGWSPLQEAIAVRSKVLVKEVLVAFRARINGEYQKRIPVLLDLLKKMPDFYMELKWEFHSWVPLLSRLCPSDNYKIYKLGSNFRVDTTLVGFDNMKWSRGDLSFVFKGEEEGGVIYVLDHENKTMEKVVIGVAINNGEISDKEVTSIMGSTTLVKTSPIMDKVTFTAAKTWMGHEKTEKIGDDAWNAKIYEVSGFDLKILNRHRVKKSAAITHRPREEVVKDLLEKSIAPTTKYTGLLFDNEAISEKLKTYKGTVWISEEFPRTTAELLPIFEILAPTQKHFQKLNSFISMKMPSSGFPVKIDIPVYPTVSGTATFTKHLATQVDPALFVIPSYPIKPFSPSPSSPSSSSPSPSPVSSPSPSSHSSSSSSSTSMVLSDRNSLMDSKE